MSKTKQTLYDIQEEFLGLVMAIEENEGEVSEEMLEELQINEEEFEDKIDNYLAVIRNYKSREESISKEIRRLQSRKSSVSKTIDRLRETIQTSMELRSMDKYKSDLFTVFFRETESVDDSQAEKIPEEYQKVKVSLDKAAIKKALQAGEEFDGIVLAKNKNLQIR